MLSYANTREKIYMIVGAIAAALTGIAYPLGFIFFGQMLKVFTDREQAQTRGLDFMIKLVIAGSLYWIFSKHHLI
jgi:NAD/NADP transhydrogenase alpha subunit